MENVIFRNLNMEKAIHMLMALLQEQEEIEITYRIDKKEKREGK